MIAATAVALALTAAMECVPLQKNNITGADLAAADPLFRAIPAERIVGYSPGPGRQRLIAVPELKAIAESSGVAISPARDLCFEWRTTAINAAAAQAAMTQEYPEARIEVIELSRYPAPEGHIVFPKSGLQRVPGAVMLWRGYIAYGEGRKFDIWARVGITIQRDRIIATQVLRPGQLIREDQVKVDQYNGPPLEAGFAVSVEEVVGRVPRSITLPGSPIKTSTLETPVEISRGDIVSVEVLNGASRISLEARAASSARLGQSVQLQNQTSGKSFRATVSGTGRAVVVLGSSK
jgi:flagella basal body P-ring formation protein FlgA